MLRIMYLASLIAVMSVLTLVGACTETKKSDGGANQSVDGGDSDSN